MTTAFLAGAPVVAEIPLINSYGEPIEAISAEYRVSSHLAALTERQVVVGFNEGDTEVTIEVDAVLNQIETGVPRELRVIELFLTTETGTIKLDHEYMVEAEQVLFVAVNSFASYASALMSAFDMVGVSAFLEASKQQKTSALIHARNNICKMAFRNVADLSKVSLSEWLNLSEDFRDCLVRAQVIEANALLGGHEVEDIRKSGLMSMTVGEAKQFFRPGRPLERAVSRATMRELSPWLDRATRIGRG